MHFTQCRTQRKGAGPIGMKGVACVIAMASALGTGMSLPAATQPAQTVSEATQNLPKPGQKIPLGSSNYFIFGFSQTPKIGMAVMKVAIFTQDGRKDTSFTVKGDVDMPSMRGMHSSGDKVFAVSAKGDYLLPVHLAMPGGWEFKFNFEKAGTTVLTGIHLFDL
jgi:hypothetical protein